MLKRIFSLVTALVLVCSFLPAAIVYAADKSEIQLLADLGIIDVTEKVTLLPETFTREDFAVALNKIDRNILLSRSANGVCCILAQKEKLAFFQNQFTTVDNMSRLPFAHINHFHIIVGMLRKMYKSRMWPNSDQLSRR